MLYLQCACTSGFHGMYCSIVSFLPGYSSLERPPSMYSRYFPGFSPLALAVSTMLYMTALVRAPRGVSQNSQFFRPTTKGRMLFSAMLFDSSHIPACPEFPLLLTSIAPAGPARLRMGGEAVPCSNVYGRRGISGEVIGRIVRRCARRCGGRYFFRNVRHLGRSLFPSHGASQTKDNDLGSGEIFRQNPRLAPSRGGECASGHILRCYENQAVPAPYSAARASAGGD